MNKTQQFCTTLGALQPLCESMIERYLPEIIENIIENNLDPFAICKILKICTDADTTPSIPTTTPGPGMMFLCEKILIIYLKCKIICRTMGICGDIP